jgi:hypothetical protein
MTQRIDPDCDALRAEIRADHDAFIVAHVENRPEFLVQDLSEDYVNVSRGELLRPAKEEVLAMFTDYLGHTSFSEYRMPEEPRIGFSDDGSVAWSIFRLKVAGTRASSSETEAHFDDTWNA